MATVNVKKINFTVQGRGYDDLRGNSGPGTKDPTIIYHLYCDTACIDETETYIWTTTGSGEHPIPWIRKRKLEDLSVVPQTTIPDSPSMIYHPMNVENNYGVCFQDFYGTGDIYVFDLTTDEVYAHISGGFGIQPKETCECILVGTDIYVANRGQYGQFLIYKIDIENETWSYVSETGFQNGHSCGFVDNDTFYAYSHAPWFSDYNNRYGYSINGALQWSVMANIQGGNGFPDCKERGLCANGYIWLPTYTDGKWHMGKYNGNTGGDFNTPSPLATIGRFSSSPEYTENDFHVYYSNGKTWGCWRSPNHGLLATNFEDVFTVSSDNWTPLAMSDNYIFARYGDGEPLGVFEY